MEQQFLSKEDILCMQYAGMRAYQIIHSKFGEEEYAESIETYIDKAENIMEIQQDHGVVTLTFQDENFPRLLRRIGNDCPPMIHCLGDLSLLTPTVKHIAVIGARAASLVGNRKAYELGKKFSEEGNIIVSGLALGCDKAAHEGCIDAGGKTIAIVASGLNIVHPKENKPLQQRILENGGLILSEQPFGIKANPKLLVARNRLQAALSDAVVLAECPEQRQYAHHALCT